MITLIPVLLRRNGAREPLPHLHRLPFSPELPRNRTCHGRIILALVPLNMLRRSNLMRTWGFTSESKSIWARLMSPILASDFITTLSKGVR